MILTSRRSGEEDGESAECQVSRFISSVGKSLRRDVQGKSDSVAGRGGDKGASKRWGRLPLSTAAVLTVENHRKGSQEAKAEGKKILDDDTSWETKRPACRSKAHCG